MSLVQSKIGFSIRKKRSTSLKNVTHEKENSGNTNARILLEKSPVRFSAGLQDKRVGVLLKKCNQNIGTKKRNQSISNSDDSDTENSCSPPKREKPSPEKGYSPSQHLNELNIRSPALLVSSKTTKEKHLSPKKLFDREINYRHARQALHSTAPAQLPAREEHLQKLQTFISDSLANQRSATLYISGPPGTGKTACLTKILSQYKQEFRRVYINCTSMKSSSCVYSRICEELGLKISGKSEKHFIYAIETFLSTNTKMILLVLDEIDQLDSKRQAVLYTVFEWPSRYKSSLVLIGIANALDLTDRILPRLQARVELKPKLMHFAPYTKQQIVDILTKRLKEMDVTEVFSPVALQLLAGKVASVSGDVRRALDIGRRVLELAEAKHSLPLQPTNDNVSNTSSPKKSSMSVDLKLVMDVLNSVYGTSQCLGAGDGDTSNDTFPLQQKVLLCSLILMMKKGNTKDATVGKLHDVYRRVCVKRNLLAVDQAEFLNLCQLVEMRGAVRVETRKEARLAKVSLQWDEQEVASALKDKQLLAAIVNDTSCLTR
ncbi:cell division control protein 6 homolog [Anabrus simplex]|uniref:cell division control protein 6 homolog n=1 Tax=Anabrus simplex TaxID=316456 RepID=UPI0035A3D5B8